MSYFGRGSLAKLLPEFAQKWVHNLQRQTLPREDIGRQAFPREEIWWQAFPREEIERRALPILRQARWREIGLAGGEENGDLRADE